MRLSPHEKSVILSNVKNVDPLARVWLFGSRVDDQKKGGDIDLLIESIRIGFKEKQTIRIGIQKELGEQKIDILICSDMATSLDPFILSISQKAQII